MKYEGCFFFWILLLLFSTEKFLSHLLVGPCVWSMWFIFWLFSLSNKNPLASSMKMFSFAILSLSLFVCYFIFIFVFIVSFSFSFTAINKTIKMCVSWGWFSPSDDEMHLVLFSSSLFHKSEIDICVIIARCSAYLFSVRCFMFDETKKKLLKFIEHKLGYRKQLNRIRYKNKWRHLQQIQRRAKENKQNTIVYNLKYVNMSVCIKCATSTRYQRLLLFLLLFLLIV